MMGDPQQGMKSFAHNLNTHIRITGTQGKIEIYNIVNLDGEFEDDNGIKWTAHDYILEVTEAIAIHPNDYNKVDGQYRVIFNDLNDEKIKNMKLILEDTLQHMYADEDSYNNEWG